MNRNADGKGSTMKLVIVGRDGTLNQYRDDHVKAPEEWVPIPGALEAVSKLNHAGWHVVLATNQAGLGRGLIDMASLNSVHLKMHQMLARVGGRVDGVFFCPHTTEDQCECRKPLPGLLLDIAKRYGMDPENIPAVGESLKDLQACLAAGCEPHVLRRGRAGLRTDAELSGLLVHAPEAQVHDDLMAFAEFLIRRERAAKGLSDATDSEHGALN
jgi:D-glycero-D-manno-heptose 1,7-bisphosphate phosphatase